MKIPKFIYRCNLCGYDQGLIFQDKREIYGFTFHRINSMHPDEISYSVLRVENKGTEYHICAHCLTKLQKEDPEIGLNKPLNQPQLQLLIGESYEIHDGLIYRNGHLA